MASLLDWGKKKLQQVEQGVAQAPAAVGNAIAHIGAAPHPVNTAPQQVVNSIQNAKYGVLAHNPVAQQRAVSYLQKPVAPPSVSTGLNNAMNAFNDTTAHAGRIIGQNIVTRPAMEVAQSVRQQVTHKPAQFTPGSPQMKYIFGDSPIQSLQANHATTQAGLQHSSNPLVRGTAPVLAGANTALHVLNDVPVLGAGLKGATKGVKAVAPVIEKAAVKAVPKAAPAIAKTSQIIQKGAGTIETATAKGLNLKPVPKVTDAEETALNRVRSSQRGINPTVNNDMTLTNQDIALHNSAMKKLGATDANPGKADKFLQSRQQYREVQGARQQTAKGLLNFAKEKGVGMSMKAVHDSSLTPEQNQFIEAYAEMKKGLGQGNGVGITADGRRVSNNVRSAENKGKRMTNADYFDEARKEIQSGKAAYGASDEYAKLGVPNEAPLEVPAGYENIGKPTAAPTTTPAGELPQPSAKPQLPASRETGGVSLDNNTPKVNNSLTQGAKAGRQNLSPETTKLTQGKHDVRNTQNLADTSATNVDKLPTNTAIEQAHIALAQPLGHVTDEQTGFIAKTIEKADSEATKARLAGNTIEADRLSREAAALHDGLSEHAVARGQANQALTMLYNRSPQGLYHSAIRDLNRAGVEVTPELQTKLQGLTDAIKTAPDRATKTDALGNFHKAVSDTMPQNIGDKAMGIWKAGLLSGVKTQQGNAISNATFGALKKISDVPATAVDKLMSIFTGQRTKTLIGRGIGQGTAEGSRNGIHTMKTGIDRRGAGDKYEQHAEINFKHPVLNKTLGTAVRTVFRGMNAADQPFWYAAFKNSMYDQAKAAGISKGLKGAGLKQFMEETVRNPNDAMANTALKEANKSTLNYDTLGSKAVQGMHTAIDKFPGATTQGKAIAHGVINVLAPFVRVPTAFLSRTVDFTPMGVGKEVFHQVASGKFDQRALSQAIGEGLTGTGVIALGVALTQRNMLSGDYPKNDPKEAQRWKAEGITPNSVKLGNKWVSLNYLGPLGLLFNAGNKLENSKGQGSANQAGQAIAGFGQGLMGQSFLQGFSGFSNAIQDPQRNLKSFVNSQAGSVIPNISNDVANVTDSMQRQANNPVQSIQSRVPVVRNKTLQPKQDVYGNPLKQPSGALGTLIGVKPSNDLTTNNAVTSEVSRLHTVDPNNTDLQVTPTPITSVTIPGATKGDKSTTVKLNDKQKYAIQTQVGQNIQSTWDKLIKTPQYQAMSDTEKAKALTNARQDATELATRKYVVDNNLGSYSKSASKGAQSLSSGSLDKYTNGTSGGTVISSKIDPHSQKVLNEYNSLSKDQIKQKAYKENDYDYKVAQAKFENDKANGKLSKAQQISRQDGLKRAKVGANFTKDIREAYSSLSKDEVYALVTTDDNGKKIASDLLAYGDALQSATGTQNKFRTKKGAVDFATAKSGGGSSKVNLSGFSLAAKAAGSGTSSLTKAKTSSAPSGKTAMAAFKRPPLKKYTVSKPKMNLNKLAKLA